MGAGLAQAYPGGKVVRIVVGAPPGGGTDLQARRVAESLARIWSSPVIVENKPGAGMTIAGAAVAQARADGYTLLYSPDNFMQATLSMRKAPYDPLKNFTPIALGGLSFFALVAHKSVPGGSLQELLAHAKSGQSKLNCATIGVGTGSHILAEIFRKRAGLDLTYVPYKGFADVFPDLVAGRVHLLFAAGSGVPQFTQTSQVRAVAVAQARRSAFLPDVPTIAEQGVRGMEVDTWLGFFGPAGLSQDKTAAIAGAIAEAMKDAAVQSEYRRGFTEPLPMSPEAFARFYEASHDKWRSLLMETSIPRE